MYRKRRMPETPVPRRQRRWWKRWLRIGVYKAEAKFPYGPGKRAGKEDEDGK